MRSCRISLVIHQATPIPVTSRDPSQNSKTFSLPQVGLGAISNTKSTISWAIIKPPTRASRLLFSVREVHVFAPAQTETLSYRLRWRCADFLDAVHL